MEFTILNYGGRVFFCTTFDWVSFHLIGKATLPSQVTNREMADGFLLFCDQSEENIQFQTVWLKGC